RDGFSVQSVGDGGAAIEAINESQPDLVVLDIMLPSVDGLTILRRLREHSDVPVILLTARGGEADRVLGLELGADDYVPKPFSPRELAARVRSVLRRSAPSATTDLEIQDFGDLVVDPVKRLVTRDGKEVSLTRREFELLVFLTGSPGQVFSRAQLLENVWDSSVEWQDPATVTVHVRRLRQKLESDPENPERIVTVWGVGYRFQP
ncbi:MAG TPA: response regulator transcription factor, partial [Actinobacteria bacterium]|nr:response regulator transcription factor [Actinomycetota bacterium]